MYFKKKEFKNSKVLFLLKRKEDYNLGDYSYIGLSTGLYNSASFVENMLKEKGIETNLEVVVDNNDIDRMVTKYKPTHVIIEALWVVPEKFEILQKLHPTVIWIIRLHSEIPFLAGEGISFSWLSKYILCDKVIIGVNAPRALRDIRMHLGLVSNLDQKQIKEKVIYLPNFYPQDYEKKAFNKKKDTIEIGCFGAIRPLKNHINQAIAAIQFSESIGKKLHFHINAGRVEMDGNAILHSLQGLFNSIDHELVEHEWKPREQFLETCRTMDIGLQVSFSETFNIVSADLLSVGVPIVGSSEIPWLKQISIANPVNTDSIFNQLMWAYHCPKTNVRRNQRELKSYTDKTIKIWVNYFK